MVRVFKAMESNNHRAVIIIIKRLLTECQLAVFSFKIRIKMLMNKISKVNKCLLTIFRILLHNNSPDRCSAYNNQDPNLNHKWVEMYKMPITFKLICKHHKNGIFAAIHVANHHMMLVRDIKTRIKMSLYAKLKWN